MLNYSTMMRMSQERAEQPFVLIYLIWEYTHLPYFINSFKVEKS